MLGVVIFWIFKVSPFLSKKDQIRHYKRLLGPGNLRRYGQDSGCL